MKYDFTVFQEPRGVMRIFQFVSSGQLVWSICYHIIRILHSMCFFLSLSILISMNPDIRNMCPVHHRKFRHRDENCDGGWHTDLYHRLSISLWSQCVQHHRKEAILHLSWCVIRCPILCSHGCSIHFILCIHIRCLFHHRWDLHSEAGDSIGCTYFISSTKYPP